ncbi:tachykinins isoform X2 [Phlebotomus papatasi]|uniref:tachykinins isoform X2 n=1 Tax=Phlebotomus papatasi TaxID=29031 RepID=UPI002483E2E8|nr:tachykinins isoform X2 [Phlebotomus papatasi]
MGTLLTSALVLVICCCSPLFLIVPTNAENAHHRRNPLGFQGVRGKRSATEIPPTSTSYIFASPSSPPEPEENDERPITPPVATNEEMDYIRGLPILSLVKRAPVGFMGMRGKKDSEVVTMDEPSMDMEGSRDKKLFLNLPFRYIPKRAPSGFMGMRGKKFSFDSYKRAPSGFLGMRGKKESEHIWPPLEDLQVEEELMHHNQDDDEQLDQIYRKLDQERELLARLSEMYGLHLWDGEKRAPSNSFFGMRGKKFYDDDESVDKRAPMGFQGMRGKKWSEDESIGYDEEIEKRAPQMGFHGMRGKKDVTDVLMGESSEKRAPAVGFFGMRGKKQPGYRISADRRNLFGFVKSKKGPYEFRDGSFLQPAQLVQSEDAPIKRVPSGFMGMRGKKWSDSPSNEQ